MTPVTKHLPLTHAPIINPGHEMAGDPILRDHASGITNIDKIVRRCDQSAPPAMAFMFGVSVGLVLAAIMILYFLMP